MGTAAGRIATTAMVSAVLIGTSALGWGVARATGSAPDPVSSPRASAPSTPLTSAPPTTPSASPTRAAAPRTDRTRQSAPLPASRPRAVPEPGPRILGPGDNSGAVRELQARLRQISWLSGDVTDNYGPSTTAAVRGFQAKREIAVTGYVDRRTMDRLEAMTRRPSADELANRYASSASTSAALDPRCRTGRVLCVDKSSRTVRWVVDGQVRRTLAVRFGSSYTPTREGSFTVGWKSRDHVSKLYDTPMPFAMFFSGGQAVHYSPDFAARGYSGASHGCVNVRDLAGISWLFDQVSVGDRVIVYWS